MPTVTLTTPSDGTTLDADAIQKLWIFRYNIETTLGVINGLLDIDNITVGTSVDARDTQRKSAVDLHFAAGTANLDYRWTWFGSYTSVTDTSATDIESTDPIQYIPGGNRQFYAKYDGTAIVMWMVFWNNDNYDAAVNTYRSDVVLMLDGAYVTAQRRSVNRTALASDNPEGYPSHRAWSGHALVDLTQGWHTVGLAVLSDKNIRNTRIHSVSINVLPFKA